MKVQSLLAVFCLFGAIQFSHAQNSKYMIDGVDTTPLVEALNAQVVTLQKPVKVYHWFNADPNSKWAEQYSANDPRGFEFVKYASQKYWNEYGNPSNDWYGSGLYTALDPIITQNYGGTNWVLVQIEFPTSSRVIDVSAPMSVPFSNSVQEILTRLDCGNLPPNIDSFFSMSKMATKKSTTGSEKCRMNLKTVLDSYLRIDAFLYRYGSTAFEGCDRASGSVAWIVTNSSRLQAHNVRIFNSKTFDAQMERISLQSLFYAAAAYAKKNLEKLVRGANAFDYLNREVQNLYPGFRVTSLDFVAMETEICATNSAQTSSECRNVPIPIPRDSTYSSKISSSDLPFTIRDAFGGLLWKDLDGKPTDPKIDEWIANNLYKCGK